MTFEVRHYSSVTEIRRAMKKISRQTNQWLTAMASQKAMLAVAALAGGQSGTAYRVRSKSLAGASLDKRSATISSLSQNKQVLTHLAALVSNEFSHETVVKKLLSDINKLLASIDTGLSNSDVVEDAIPKALGIAINRVSTYLSEYLGVPTKSRTLLTSNGSALTYTHYMTFNNVKDRNGFVYPEYNVALIYSDTDGVVKQTCAAFAAFLPPEQVNGTPYRNSKQAVARLRTYFTSNNIIP